MVMENLMIAGFYILIEITLDVTIYRRVWLKIISYIANPNLFGKVNFILFYLFINFLFIDNGDGCDVGSDHQLCQITAKSN